MKSLFLCVKLIIYLFLNSELVNCGFVSNLKIPIFGSETSRSDETKFAIRMDVNGTSITLPQYSLLYVSRAIESQHWPDLVPLEEKIVDQITSTSNMTFSEEKLFANLLAPGLCDALTRQLTWQYLHEMNVLSDAELVNIKTPEKHMVPIELDGKKMYLPSYGFLFMFGALRNTFKYNGTELTGPIMTSAFKMLTRSRLISLEKLFYHRLSTATCDQVTTRIINEYKKSALLTVEGTDWMIQSIDLMAESLTESMATVASLGLPTGFNVAPIIQAIGSTFKWGR